MRIQYTLILLSMLIVSVCTDAYAQRIEYTYDASGNRISRKKEIVLTKSAESPATVFTEELAERTIKIYPNPTEGHLKVEISDFEACQSVNLSIYNMQGQVVIKRKMESSVCDLDISGRPNG
ncbi:MAG: T9SS type A sorting domain-containing protein, partial [Prevotella sp.]|nr:T9SS type A sorting domain-containing protein [Prevotella sp.]